MLGKSAAEIVAYHAASQRILTVNARSGEIDILDASDPTQPRKIGAISAGGDKEINSVAVRPDGLAVAAVQQADKTDSGEALFSTPRLVRSSDAWAWARYQITCISLPMAATRS